MTINSLAPGFIKLYYVQNLLTHVQTIPVSVAGDPTVGEEPEFTPNVGAPILMSAFIDEYIAILQPLFGADTSFSSAEYWNQPEPEDDPTWYFTYPIGEVGTSGTASVDLLQAVMTFRTALGGIYRNYLMEISGSVPVNLHTSFPFSAGPFADLAEYLTGDTSCVLGRDNAALIVPIAFTTKYNDALRKKRLLL